MANHMAPEQEHRLQGLDCGSSEMVRINTVWVLARKWSGGRVFVCLAVGLAVLAAAS